MNCPTCNNPMLAGESGYVCATPGCNQRIVLYKAGKVPKAASVIKYRKSVQQRGDQMAEGLKGLGE